MGDKEIHLSNSLNDLYVLHDDTVQWVRPYYFTRSISILKTSNIAHCNIKFKNNNHAFAYTITLFLLAFNCCWLQNTYHELAKNFLFWNSTMEFLEWLSSIFTCCKNHVPCITTTLHSVASHPFFNFSTDIIWDIFLDLPIQHAAGLNIRSTIEWFHRFAMHWYYSILQTLIDIPKQLGQSLILNK